MTKNTPTKTKEFKWNPKRLKAAKMLAESTQTQEKIAEEVGGGGFLKFKPFHTRCPSCRKHIYIMSEDQKIVECANCGDKWNITFAIRKKVKLSKIVSE